MHRKTLKLILGTVMAVMFSSFAQAVIMENIRWQANGEDGPYYMTIGSTSGIVSNTGYNNVTTLTVTGISGASQTVTWSRNSDMSDPIGTAYLEIRQNMLFTTYTTGETIVHLEGDPGGEDESLDMTDGQVAVGILLGWFILWSMVEAYKLAKP